jgi:hypothetical protein
VGGGLGVRTRQRHGLGAAQREVSLPRCDELVEQREHRSMTSHVIDMNEGGRAVAWTQDLVANLVSRIGVMNELVSRRNHCA